MTEAMLQEAATGLAPANPHNNRESAAQSATDRTGGAEHRLVVYRDPADVRSIFQLLTALMIILCLFTLSAIGNAWQYWRRPDRIVVDRSNGRVLMINNRKFGETEAVKMTPDHPGNEDKKYLVGEFVRLLYGVNPATRAADVKSALEMMIPQSAAKFAAYLKEQHILERQRAESWQAVWTPQDVSIDRIDPYTLRVIGRQQIAKLVNNPTPEYRSGEVRVAVRGNENPIIRLGLAPNGVTLVEFPASDNFFAINPGNTDLVTIEDSPTKETDHFFVIRPGAGFLPANEGAKSPATSIIVQMSSGMVVTFLLYPARDIESNAHRCVVTYDREAVINARRAAGLAVNIDLRAKEPDPKRSSTSMRIATPVEASPCPASTVAPPDNNEEVKNEMAANMDDSKSRSPLHDMSFPGEKDKWSKGAHGLKIAARTEVVDVKLRRVIVAVRNTLSKPVTIAPGYPELYIHTLDEKGRALQTETLKHVKVECSSPEGLIAPGGTLRYLLTYEAPVLGAKQRLDVAVAQTNAADDPVTTELAASGK